MLVQTSEVYREVEVVLYQLFRVVVVAVGCFLRTARYRGRGGLWEYRAVVQVGGILPEGKDAAVERA